MAITIEVRGNNNGSGNGGNNVPPTPPPPPGGGNPSYPPGGNTPGPPNGGYNRINVQDYAPNGTQSGIPAMPGSDRIAEDIRREIQQRGIVMVPGTQNFTTMMNQMRQQQQQNLSNAIDTGYGNRKDYLLNLRDRGHGDIEDRLFAAQQNLTATITDPTLLSAAQNKLKRLAERDHDKLDKYFQPFLDQADTEKANQRIASEDELTKAIKLLTEEFQRRNPNSYLGSLRDKYREAVWKRDNASSEEEAKEYARQAREAQERLGKAMNPDGNMADKMLSFVRGGGTFSLINSGLRTATSLRQMQLNNQATDYGLIDQTAGGNVFGAVQADAQRNMTNRATEYTTIGTGIGAVIGGALAAIGSLGIGTAAGAGIGAAAGGMVGGGIASLVNAFSDDAELVNQAKLAQVLQSNEGRISQYNALAMMTRGGGSVKDARDRLMALSYRGAVFSNPDADGATGTSVDANVNTIQAGAQGVFGPNSDLSLYDLGYTAPQFAQIAAQRIAARGFGATNSDVAIRRAFNADALEKVFSMGNGSLNQLASWDRYSGSDYTQVFANIAATMDRLGARGFSHGDYGRAGEFLGYYGQLMQNQISQGNLIPNDTFALRNLAALQNSFGNSLNSNIISDYNKMYGTVQRPGGGMNRVMLYDVIQRMFPEARGNLAAIRRLQYSQNSNTRQAIMRAYLKRIQDTYGSLNTTQGMLAFQSAFGIENPFEMGKLTQAVNYRGGTAEGNVNEYVNQVKGYASPITQATNKIADATMAQTAAYQDKMTGMIDTMIATFAAKLDTIIRELGQ